MVYRATCHVPDHLTQHLYSTAEDLFEQMERYKLKPDVWTYNEMIRVRCAAAPRRRRRRPVSLAFSAQADASDKACGCGFTGGGGQRKGWAHPARDRVL